MYNNGKGIGCGTIILGLIVLDVAISIMAEAPIASLFIVGLVLAYIFREPLREKFSSEGNAKYEAYIAAIGDYIDTPVADLADACGDTEDKVMDTLYAMIGKGYFVNAYFDGGVFIVPGNTKVRDASGPAAYETGSSSDDAADDESDGAADGDGSADADENGTAGEAAASGKKPAVNGIRCPYCGEEIPRTLKFCYFCGKSLEVITEIEALRHESAETIGDALTAEMDDAVRENIVSIGEVSEKILRKMEEEPDLIEGQHRFKDYYLPKTITAIRNYKELCLMTELDKEEEDLKKQIEESLDTIETAFSRILRKVSIDGVVDLSADVSTLNKVLEQEGLTDPDFKVDQ